MKLQEVKRGYWFWDSVLSKPKQALADGDTEIVDNRRYKPLGIDKAILLRFGFVESREPGLYVYTKKGFRVCRKRDGEDYQLEHFGELGPVVRFVHELQQVYRREVEG